MQERLTESGFEAAFASEEACIEYLFQVKWPTGFACPRCRHGRAYVVRTRRLPLFECAACRHQASLTAGTILQGSRTLLTKWFLAIYLIAQPDSCTNALGLSRRIDVTYKTAWLMLHKIRHAMGDADANVLLAGLVELNDAYLGHPFTSTIHLQPQQTPVLLGATMDEADQPGYIKIKQVPQAQARGKSVHPIAVRHFLDKYVRTEEGQVNQTIGWMRPRSRKRLYPLFQAVKCWINRVFHGLGPRHLQKYLDEFCYRLNQGWKKRPIFGDLMRVCAAASVLTYRELVAGGGPRSCGHRRPAAADGIRDVPSAA